MVFFKFNQILIFLTIFKTFDNIYATACTEIIEDFFEKYENYTTVNDYVQDIFENYVFTDFTEYELIGYANYLMHILYPGEDMQLPDKFCEDEYNIEFIQYNCKDELQRNINGDTKYDVIQYAFQNLKVNNHENNFTQEYLKHLLNNYNIEESLEHTPSEYCGLVNVCNDKIENEFGDTSEYSTGFDYARDIIENHTYNSFLSSLGLQYAAFLLKSINPDEECQNAYGYCEAEAVLIEDKKKCASQLYYYGIYMDDNIESCIAKVYSTICITSPNIKNPSYIYNYITHVKTNVIFTGDSEFPDGPTPFQYCLGHMGGIYN